MNEALWAWDAGDRAFECREDGRTADRIRPERTKAWKWGKR